LKLSIERGGGFVAGVESACLSREVLPLGKPAASKRACTCLKLSETLLQWKRPARLEAPGPSPAFSPAVNEPRQGLRHLLSTEISTAAGGLWRRDSRRRAGLPLSQSRLHVGFSQSSGLYTGASSPSFLSSFLSALCVVGHVQASVDTASSIIASASHVRIFHLGLSLQRLATYNATASALASAKAAFLTSTGRGASRLSLAAREGGLRSCPENTCRWGATPAPGGREARGSRKAAPSGPSLRRGTWPTSAVFLSGLSALRRVSRRVDPSPPTSDKPQLPRHSLRNTEQ